MRKHYLEDTTDPKVLALLYKSQKDQKTGFWTKVIIIAVSFGLSLLLYFFVK